MPGCVVALVCKRRGDVANVIVTLLAAAATFVFNTNMCKGKSSLTVREAMCSRQRHLGCVKLIPISRFCGECGHDGSLVSCL